MLLFDQAHYRATGVYCLIDPAEDDFYAFETAQEVREFSKAFWYDPEGAKLLYEAYDNDRVWQKLSERKAI